MPTGTYDMGSLLADKLNSLSINIPEELNESYSTVVKYTIGFNPRSLKRYINSFSLLRNLRNSDFESDAEEFGDSAPDFEDDLILFAMIGVQISYPKIFRMITQFSDIYDWDKTFANKNNINLDLVKTEIEKYGDNDKLDEDWEQIIYGACQNDVYLKSKVFNILELFNFLRTKFNTRLEVLDEKIIQALKFAAITNVDDDNAMKGAVEKRGRKSIFSTIDSKLALISEDLNSRGAKPDGVKIKLNIYKQIYDIISNINIGQDVTQTILGSYVKFEADGPIAYLFNPPKQTELVSLELYKLRQTDKYPKGLSLDKENPKYDSKVFKVSKDLDQKELNDFLTSNFSK
jgi:hypothetical protein